MSALPANRSEVSEEEYLAFEAQAEEKHEYLGGAIYAMAGASEPHSRIAANLLGLLHAGLRGKPCEPFGSDMKVRLRPLDAAWYYYPDAMVACDPADTGRGWRERPSALFEIISEQTRRVDEREKRIVYLQLDSLQAYVRIEQEKPEIVIEHRTPVGWQAERLTGMEAILRLPELGLELPLDALYERVVF